MDRSLLTLHSQPPFRNFLLGLADTACSAQEACMIQLIWRSHLLLKTGRTLYYLLFWGLYAVVLLEADRCLRRLGGRAGAENLPSPGSSR